MRVTSWTENHEVKRRGSCCGLLRDQLVHGAKILHRNAGNYFCLPNYTVPYENGQTCLQVVVPQSDSGGDNGKKLQRRASLQAGCNTGPYFHITPTKHNYSLNKFASVTKQPELHNLRGLGGGGSPPTQQERPVPSLQTALPYPVKGGAKQIMFRSCLLSRYAVIYERDNPPSPHVLQQCICKCRSPMQFHILHPPNETFTQTYRTGSTPLI